MTYLVLLKGSKIEKIEKFFTTRQNKRGGLILQKLKINPSAFTFILYK